jgi:phospholipase/lecithinase/hemolysin
VDILSTTWNKTFVEAINVAYGEATVDSALVAPYLPTVLSFKQQGEDDYSPWYSNHPPTFNGQVENTLFAIFIGINDVGNASGEANAA